MANIEHKIINHKKFNKTTVKAIKEVQKLKKEVGKKTYNSFHEVLKEINNDENLSHL